MGISTCSQRMGYRRAQDAWTHEVSWERVGVRGVRAWNPRFKNCLWDGGYPISISHPHHLPTHCRVSGENSDPFGNHVETKKEFGKLQCLEQVQPGLKTS